MGTTWEWKEKVPEPGEKDNIFAAATYCFYTENEEHLPADGRTYWHFDSDGKTPVIWQNTDKDDKSQPV